MKRLLTIIKMEARMVLGNRRALVTGVLIPAVILLLFGYNGQRKMTQAAFGSEAKVTYPAYLLVSMIAFAGINLGIFSYAPDTAALRELGILRRVRCTPLPTWQFLASRVLVRIGAIVASGLVLTVVAMARFGVRLSWPTVPVGVVLLIVVAGMFLAIGQLIAALVPNRETASVVSRLVGFVLFFAGNLFVAATDWPAFLTHIMRWTPTSVTLDLLRPTFLQGSLGPQAALNLLVLVGYLAVAFALATRFFRWNEAA